MTDPPNDLISIALAAGRTGLPVDALVAEALRRHGEIPIFVQPDPPGWRAVLLQADAGTRVPEFQEFFPDDSYDTMLTEPILLTPDVLREVMSGGTLHRVTIDGETIGTVREEPGYTAWSIAADHTADFEPDSAVTRYYKEAHALCEPQQITLGSLLVPKAALGLLRADLPDPRADILLAAVADVQASVAKLRDEVSRDVMTRTEVIEWIGGNHGNTRRWLDAQGLGNTVGKRTLYVRAELVERLRANPPQDRHERPKRTRKPKQHDPAGIGGAVVFANLRES